MTEYRMPSLGADMDAGTLVLWKIKPGDRVKRGDVIAEVETAKGVIEIEIFEDGILDEIITPVGKKVPVGEVLARFCSEGEMAIPVTPKKVPVETTPASQVATQVAPQVVMAEVTPAVGGQVAEPAGERVRISPLARRVASDLGVDITMLHGTGQGGAITRADVERAAQVIKAAAQVSAPVQPVVKAVEQPAATPPAIRTVPPATVLLQAVVATPIAATPPPSAPVPTPPAEEKKPADFQTAMRQAIAAAMSKANRDIPHYYLETHIDMGRALRWLEEENQKRSVKERLLPVVLLLKATARALVDVPELNGFWIDDRLQVSEAIHIGFAISLRQGGLVTPAIHDVDTKTLDDLREAVSDLIMRTRAGRLRSSEMTDPTITLTSLGDRGVEKVFGVIYPPQVALVGFGKTSDQVWVENGMIGIRPVMVATLAGDHRASDGHRGGIFLEALNHYLQEVEKL